MCFDNHDPRPDLVPASKHVSILCQWDAQSGIEGYSGLVRGTTLISEGGGGHRLHTGIHSESQSLHAKQGCLTRQHNEGEIEVEQDWRAAVS